MHGSPLQSLAHAWRSIASSVGAGLSEVEAAEISEQRSRAALEQSRAALLYTTDTYRAGRAKLPHVLEAHDQALRNEIRLADTAYFRDAAIVRLHHHLGGAANIRADTNRAAQADGPRAELPYDD